MNILAVETSCDETSLAVIDATGDEDTFAAATLSHNTASQIELHQQYGGVFPSLAKRAHGEKLTPLLQETLQQADLENKHKRAIDTEELQTILSRESTLRHQLPAYLQTINPPTIDAIAVTTGPGLEPALWVGINFAKALAVTWNIPVVPVNHMEGHIASVLKTKDGITPITFPAVALLASGGHTELIYAPAWGTYEKLGETLDDAAGEAFDKVARMLELPYPGGPEISRLATQATSHTLPTFPRPMSTSGDYNFSFSGLKTAVKYYIRDHEPLNDTIRADIAAAFQEAVVDVISQKVSRALSEYTPQTLIVAGGVAANEQLRAKLQDAAQEHRIPLRLPLSELATDNALMIAYAGYFKYKSGYTTPPEQLHATGTLSL